MVLTIFPSSLPSTGLQCLTHSEGDESSEWSGCGKKRMHSLGKARISSLYAMQTEVMDSLGNKDPVYLSVDLKAR